MNEWISVKDRLPDYDVEVLVWTVWGDLPDAARETVIAYRPDPDGSENLKRPRSWRDHEGDALPEGIVTHWMPLPEPPKEDSI